MPEPTELGPVNEKTSGLYTATLVGHDGVTPVPGPTISTLTLTLYVTKADGTDQIVNGRDHQNVLNAANVTISAGGLLTWTYQPADTTLVEDIPFERHIALFEWTTPSIPGGKHQVVLIVQNLRQVS